MPPCGTSEALLGSLVTASRLITTLDLANFLLVACCYQEPPSTFLRSFNCESC